MLWIKHDSLFSLNFYNGGIIIPGITMNNQVIM